MSSEIYSPKIQAAIADFLRQVDSTRNTDNFGPVLFTGEFQRRFGSLNCAGLEQVFRNSNFNTYCLAVPIELAAERMGGKDQIVAVLPDDGLKILKARKQSQPIDKLFSKIQKVPYTLFMYPGLRVVDLAALDWGFAYDPVINMANLHKTGVMTPKPGTNYSRMVGSFNRGN